jgi:hypothetical protein
VITAAMLAVVIPMVLIALVDRASKHDSVALSSGLLLPPIFAVAIAYVGTSGRPPEDPGGSLASMSPAPASAASRPLRARRAG